MDAHDQIWTLPLSLFHVEMPNSMIEQISIHEKLF